jgi:hypothetical protein
MEELQYLYKAVNYKVKRASEEDVEQNQESVQHKW